MNLSNERAFPALKNLSPAEALCTAIGRIYRRMLTTPSGGNLSIRDKDGIVWITPSMIDKGSLTPDDIVAVLPDGTLRGKHKPSSEYPFHIAIYKARPELTSVVHAHPVSLVAASIAGKLPHPELLPAALLLCPQTAIAPYALPGSRALGERIAAVFAQGVDTVFLESHGIVVGGADLESALRRFETIEHLTDIEIAALRLQGTLSVPAPADALVQLPALRVTSAVASSSEEAALRDSLAAFIRRGYVQRLIWPGLYNFSARIGHSDDFLINPALNDDPASIEPEALVKVNARNLTAAGAAPHPFAWMHAALYAREKACNSVFISAPTAVGAFCVSNAPFDTRTIPESYIFLRDVKRMGAAWWKDGARAWLDTLSIHHPVRFLENTGAAVIGRSAFGVFDGMEVLESTARSILESGSFGPVLPMGDEAIIEIKQAFKLQE